jgi:hypothetical protein
MTEPKICNCDEGCWVCQNWSDERKRKIQELTNSPEYVAFIKEWKAQIDFIKQGLCQIAGCSSYCGDKHTTFSEDK